MKKNLIILLLMLCGSAYGQAELETEGKIYVQVEQIAEFKGGHKEFLEFLANNPLIFKDSSDRKADAKVVVSFKVGIDGSVNNFRVMKEHSYGLSEENLKQIENQWKFYPLGKKEEIF